MDDTMVLVEPDAIEVVTTQDQDTKQRQWMLEETFDGNDTAGKDGILGEIKSDFGLRIDERRCALWDGAVSVGA
jgi:polyphosphate kinase 2 (PPK2 family)